MRIKCSRVLVLVAVLSGFPVVPAGAVEVDDPPMQIVDTVQVDNDFTFFLSQPACAAVRAAVAADFRVEGLLARFVANCREGVETGRERIAERLKAKERDARTMLLDGIDRDVFDLYSTTGEDMTVPVFLSERGCGRINLASSLGQAVSESLAPLARHCQGAADDHAKAREWRAAKGSAPP